jgi:flagellar biosynthesis protein FliR
MLARTSFVLMLSLFVANSIEPIQVGNVWEIVGLIIIEVLIGFLLAFVIEMMIAIVQIAGSILDLDIGLANPFYDGISGSQATVLSKLFYYIFILVFLLSGGFEKMVFGIVGTFELTVQEGFLKNLNHVDFFIELFQQMFFGAIQIAVPFMMATFLVYISLLLMSKVVDKINLLMNIFGIKIFVGITMITIMIPAILVVFQQVDEQLISRFYEYVTYIFRR